MEHSRVLVIGATRGTGYEIVQRLLREGYQVRVLARDGARACQRLGEAVEVVVGDVRRPETLPAAVNSVGAIILTAAVIHRVAGQQAVRATVYEGTLNTLAAARHTRFTGRFLYMSALGTRRGSWLGFLLSRIKGNTLRWRRLAEEAIRLSGLDYTIIHAGILTNAPAGQRAIEISQHDYPLLPRYRISRGDVAEVFVQALRHPRTRNTTFDAVWTQGLPTHDWEALFGALVAEGE
ncbi:MAG TPA: SDR family oxidoreductase [Longimicrobiaceae bacterium]|nr:SDR family oxidoreductase [Longimicrobiaceae bacterium]